MKTKLIIFLFVIGLSPLLLFGQGIIITPGAMVTVQNNACLKASSSAGITIKSDASGAGSFLDQNSGSGNVTFSGTQNVERYMSGNWTSGPPLVSTRWHAVSSPVLNPSNNLFYGSLMDKWDEANQTWIDLTLPYENMTLMKGYLVAPTNPGITATFTGPLNTGDKSISGLTITSGSWSGFNLIGNPFPSAIQWNTSIQLTNVNEFAWIWNGTAWISNAKASLAVIPASQGFFVQVASATGTVLIPNANRLHSSQTYYKSEITDFLTLRIDGNGYWDQTQIRILPGSSNEYESRLDALKLMGSEFAPQFFSYKQDIDISILSLPTLTVYPVVRLGFKPGTAGNFTITASGLETFNSRTNCYLEDLVNGTNQDLNISPVYTFSAVPGQPEHRFNLHFAAIGLNEQEKGHNKIYSYDKKIYVNISEAIHGDIIVYNLLGVEIFRKPIVSNSLNTIELHQCTGYYIVSVVGETGNFSNKVFIR